MNEKLTTVISLLVKDGKTPPWLEPCLQRQLNRIAAFREGEARAPGRGAIKSTLENFRDAVVTLKEGMADPDLHAFLGYDREGFEVDDRAVLRSLERLSARAHEAILRIAAKPKQPQAFPREGDEGIGAKMLCAWTAMRLIETMDAVSAGKPNPTSFVEDFPAGASNPFVHDVANALWAAAGGAGLGSKDGSRGPTGWRHHLEEAKRASCADDPRSRWLAHELAMFEALPGPA